MPEGPGVDVEPVLGLIGEDAHGTRHRVECVGCAQTVTISHGAHAPVIDLTAYRCLRCRGRS